MTEPTLPMPDAGWGQSAPQEAPPARRPPRRRRRGTKWLIALVVLIALLVAADRIALLVAENQLADRIESSQHLSSKPGVSVDGFPFLNQVIARDFPHATVDIHDLDANGLTITNLHAELHGVHVNSGFNSAVVDTLTATAQMSYTDIAKALASKVSLGGAQIGTVQITPASGDEVKASFALAGVTFTANVAVSLVQGTNTLEFKSLGYNSTLPSALTPPGFDVTYSLAGLPFGIKLTGLTLGASELDVAASGTNVNLSQTADSNG